MAGARKPSSIDWVGGSSRLIGSVHKISRLRTSLATHRAIMIRLRGSDDLTYEVHLAGARPNRGLVVGPLCQAGHTPEQHRGIKDLRQGIGAAMLLLETAGGGFGSNEVGRLLEGLGKVVRFCENGSGGQ